MSVASFTFTMRRHLIESHQRHLPPPVWQSLVGFRLSCATPGNEAQCRIYEWWVKTPVLFLALCGPKFMKVSDGVHIEDQSYFQTPLPDCLYLSCKRYSPLSLEVVEKPNRCIKFLVPNFLERMTRAFLWQTVNAIYCPPFGKVWLSSICWSPSAKPSNEVDCRIYRQCVKMMVQFWAVADHSS